MRVNECMKNEKFKEIPIPTIYKIINSAITTNRETVDINKLYDFIVESSKNRIILLKFIELDRLSKDKLDEFIKFIDELDSTSKRIYLEYIPFNFLFIKETKREYEELSKLYQQTNKKELKQTKEELKQIKVESNPIKINTKICAHTITASECNDYNQLGENLNKNNSYVHPQKSSIDQFSYHSQSIAVTQLK